MCMREGAADWYRDMTHHGGMLRNELRGCGPFLHDDPRDRPPAIFGGRTTLHFGPERPASVLLPVVPPR